MWVIFFIGTSLSLITYLESEGRDFRSGILNTVDICFVGTNLVWIWRYGIKKKFGLSEKLYLILGFEIALFWLITGNDFLANILVQILMTLAYLPKIEDFIKTKKNTESFDSWILSYAASSVGLYLAIMGKRILAVLYATRSIIMMSVMFGFMIYFSLKNRGQK
jgi:hypothetical protein